VKAERVGAVQPGEEKAPDRSYCGLSILKGSLQEMMGTDFLVGPVVIGQRVMVLKSKRVDLD